jgi:hypothetical protein
MEPSVILRVWGQNVEEYVWHLRLLSFAFGKISILNLSTQLFYKPIYSILAFQVAYMFVHFIIFHFLLHITFPLNDLESHRTPGLDAELVLNVTITHRPQTALYRQLLRASFSKFFFTSSPCPLFKVLQCQER